MGMGRIEPARGIALGVMAVALAACASTPMPVTSSVADAVAPTPQSLPFDPSVQPRITDPTAHSQCVPYARLVSGIEIYGNASTWWEQAAGRYARSNVPAPGSVFVMRGYRDANRGHVAVVTHIESARVIRIDHANWLNGGEITVDVPVLDVSPNNDWSEVRVWWIPTGTWGARIYEAQGFIHPFALRGAFS